MRLVGVGENVRSLLALTALDRVFPMYETIEEALAAPQLSLISIPPGDVSPATEALKTGMKMSAASLGVAAIADLMMSDGSSGFGLEGGDEEDLVDDDDDEYADDLEDDDDLVDDEDAVIVEEVEVEEVVSDDDLAESIEDDDIEEIEEDDMLEADDFDLDDEDEEDEELY
jgi:hypothetical protein